ncbi:uncharacterized protein METZ01_LOCUS5653 [marine metagenome]|uniref:Uncharacterized protein n=1 Tax=marine metagenome TaxID=408172 RepID=A0A381NEI0_9ZZZZ
MSLKSALFHGPNEPPVDNSDPLPADRYLCTDGTAGAQRKSNTVKARARCLRPAHRSADPGQTRAESAQPPIRK